MGHKWEASEGFEGAGWYHCKAVLPSLKGCNDRERFTMTQGFYSMPTRLNLDYCVQFWLPSTGKTLTYCSEPRGEPPRWLKGWGTWCTCLFSFKKQRLLAAYSYLRGECREDGGRVFLNTHGDRTGENRHELWQGKFQSDGRKTLPPWWRSDTGTGAREAVESPSLEMLTTHLVVALSNLI